MADLIDQLIDQGFEVTQHEDESVRVRCDQCAATVINGMACHETGCPAERAARRAREREVDDDWDDDRQRVDDE